MCQLTDAADEAIRGEPQARGRRALLQLAFGSAALVAGGRLLGGSSASAADNQDILQGSANDAHNTAGSTTTLQASLDASPVLVVKNNSSASGSAQAIVADASAGGLPLLVKGSPGLTGAGVGVQGVDEGLALQVFGVTSGKGIETGAEGGIGLDSFATSGIAIRAVVSSTGTAIEATTGNGTAIRARSTHGKALDVRGDSAFAGKASFKRGVTARRFAGTAAGGVPAFPSVGRGAIAVGRDRVSVTFAGASARSTVLVTLMASPGPGVALSHVETGAGQFTVVLTGVAKRRSPFVYFVVGRG